VRLGAPALGALTALSLLGFTAQAHATADPAGYPRAEPSGVRHPHRLAGERRAGRSARL